MYLRPLTDAEINQIREAKRAANEAITKQRQALAKEIKTYKYGNAPSEMVERYEVLKPITGKPAWIQQGDNNRMLLDYELLQKLYKSICRRRWSCEIRLFAQSQDKKLALNYQAGLARLYALPKYQEFVLTKGLPVIEIKEA